MKVVGGSIEQGIEVGNHFDKYNSKNPIVKWLMNGFDSSLQRYVDRARPSNLHEIGCGEGIWTLKWRAQGIDSRGSDFSEVAISVAKENSKTAKIRCDFKQKNIYELDKASDSADLLVCCEVLEHLENPAKALEKLSEIAENHIILSVPHEPIWSILNFARGKYWSQLGNTPGHIQKWSKVSFIGLVSKYFEVLEVSTPLPWVMLLCKKK